MILYYEFLRWVNVGCETSCLEMAEALAAETPVRLDLLLSLAPAAPSNSNSVVVPSQVSILFLNGALSYDPQTLKVHHPEAENKNICFNIFGWAVL